MRLNPIQRDAVDAWLAANMDRRHTPTWAACELAPLLGLGRPPLAWAVLHALAGEVRRRCKAQGIPFKDNQARRGKGAMQQEVDEDVRAHR